MTTATLRSLYGRATRSFLHRDIALTHSLLQSAFSIIHSPTLQPDALAEYRRKWDILRITFETLIYSSPPRPPTTLPDDLKQLLLESPQAFLNSMYTRSLTLFTPSEASTPKGAFGATCLPPQVLLTLVYASVKLNCHDSGRYMIEQWLARRDPLSPPDSVLSHDGNGYEKALELYCLHILPHLEQWEYAREFLEYETELPDTVREKFKLTLNALHAQALAARKTPQPTYVSSSLPSSSSRPASPTPSTCSTSSLSTASNHTIKPSRTRGRRHTNSLLPLASASTDSLASDTTATPHGYSSSRKSRYTNGHGSGHPHDLDHRGKLTPTNRSSSRGSHQSSSSSSPWSSFPFVSTANLESSDSSTYAIVKATVASYFTLPKLSTLFIIFVLFPVISFLLRLRHRRRKLLAGGGATNGDVMTPLRNGSLNGTNVELVRKKLQQIGTADASLIWKLWTEIVKMVMDTVKMAGSGLV